MTRGRARAAPGPSGGLIPADRGAYRLIESYLADVGARMPGPARARDAIMDELRSGLLDAADGYRSSGLPAERAAGAVREFGQPSQVAAAFRPGLASIQARRLALGLLATGPLVGLLWASAAMASHVGIRPAPPWQWAGAPPGAPVAFPLAAVTIVVAVWMALLTVAATGRLTRRLSDRPRLAPTAALVAGAGATVTDVIVLLLLAGRLLTAPGTLAPGLVAVAALASLTRMILAGRAARCCLAARAALA